MKSKLKNFSLLTISTLIMAVGIYFFKFANNFTFGGITGIAVLVAKFLPISASDFSFVVNILLLIIGWIVLGKSFAEKTAYSTILLSISLSLLERIYPMSHPLTNEPLLELIFAILLPALGSAILFNIGASSGGTDVIAMILKKYTSVDIGKGLMISDLIFTLAGFLVFNVKTGLYSLFGLIMRSALIDNFIESFNRSKYFHVVTSNATCICDFIQNDLQRGATIVNATGAFTGDDKYIILTVLSPFKFHYVSINSRPKTNCLFTPRNTFILSTSSKYIISFSLFIICFSNTSYFSHFLLLSIPCVFYTITGRQKSLYFYHIKFFISLTLPIMNPIN